MHLDPADEKLNPSSFCVHVIHLVAVLFFPIWGFVMIGLTFYLPFKKTIRINGILHKEFFFPSLTQMNSISHFPHFSEIRPSAPDFFSNPTMIKLHACLCGVQSEFRFQAERKLWCKRKGKEGNGLIFPKCPL